MEPGNSFQRVSLPDTTALQQQLERILEEQKLEATAAVNLQYDLDATMNKVDNITVQNTLLREQVEEVKNNLTLLMQIVVATKSSELKDKLQTVSKEVVDETAEGSNTGWIDNKEEAAAEQLRQVDASNLESPQDELPPTTAQSTTE